jgi:hypothetical protein
MCVILSLVPDLFLCFCAVLQSLEFSEPLVGNVAPDFVAEAVFDQEFVKVKTPATLRKSLLPAR